MRISSSERTAIKEIVRQADAKAKVYLFGSRADDRLRGGDIDLLIISDRLDLKDKVDLLSEMKLRLGEQKIDLLIRNPRARRSDPFVDEILKSAALL